MFYVSFYYLTTLLNKAYYACNYFRILYVL